MFHHDTDDETIRRDNSMQSSRQDNPMGSSQWQPAQPSLQNSNGAPTGVQTSWQATPSPAPVPYDESTAPFLRGQWQPQQAPAPQQPQQPPQPVRRGSRGLRTGAILLLTLLLAVVFGTGLFAGWQFGRGSAAPTLVGSTTATSPQPTIPALNGNNTESVREAVVAKVRPAVVQVNVTTSQGNAIGSGVIIDQRGYIVTNNHVVNGGRNIQVVLNNGTRETAQLVGTDSADDLAVIKINPPSNITVVTIGDSSKLRVGQEVLAVGNPLGITQTVTNGIVSALNRSVSEGQGGATIPDAIQTDAPINPGNSGGALVDMQGNLIGIPTLTAIDPQFNTPASGVGFAIPANRVKLIVPQLIQNGSVAHTGRAVLGIAVTSVDSTFASQNNLSVNSGVFISQVVSGGPASHAGLQTGDVIVQINSTPINDVSSLGDALATKNPGDTVSVKFYRGNQQQTVNVTLGELQASP